MTAPSQLERVNNRYRALLLAREAEAVKTFSKAYATTFDAVSDRITDIAATVDTTLAGKDRTPAGVAYQLAREERYRNLQAELAVRMELLEEGVNATVKAEQQFAVRQGRESAMNQIQAVYGDLGRDMVDLVRIPTEQLTNLVGNLADGSPLRDLLHNLGPDARRRIEGALIEGIATGLNPREVARMTRAAFGGNLARAMTVSRTEMYRVYRQTALEHFKENKHAVARWRWSASMDDRTCVICVAMHGQQFDLDEPFGSHPNCRCVASPVPPRSRVQTEKPEDWAERQSPERLQQLMGRQGYAAYADGRVGLSDFVKVTRDPQWGVSRSTASLKSLGVGRVPVPAIPASIPSQPQFVPFDDIAAGHQQMRAEYETWARSVDSVEQEAFKLYQSSGYRGINGALRESDAGTVQDYATEIKALDNAISRGVLEQDTVAFRYITDDGAKPFLDNPTGAVGTVTSDKGFLSTSIHEQHVEKWAGYAVEENRPTVIAELHLPQGSKGAYMGDFFLSSMSEEYELLLPRGSQFVVESVSADESGITRLVMVLVDG